MTETFVAAKLYVDNWRWADTPFYLRLGKRLARRETTIAIQFQRAPHPPFAEIAGDGLRPNVLLIHVQPDEGVSLAIGAKVPGQGMQIRTVHMDFLYGGAFRTGLPEAYERLILDCMLGDATLFTRSDEVDEQWALVDSIVSGWSRDRPQLPELRGRHVGPVLCRRPDPSGRAVVAAALTDASLGEVEQALAEQRPPEVPADERDDASRLGAEGVARAGGARARRDGGTAPVAHGDPHTGAAAEGRPRRDRRRRHLRRRGLGAGRLVGGRRAAAEGRAREGARVDRDAAPDRRPARLLPLARRAAVGRRRARPARRRRRPPRRRLDRVEGTAAGLRAARPSCSDGSPSRTSPGLGRATGVCSSRSSGRTSGSPARSR